MTRDNPVQYRIIGAVWFALGALLVAGALYLFPAVESGRFSAAVLFVFLPGLAALLVGAWLGPRLLDPRRSGPWKAIGLGLLAVVLIHLVFSLLFTLVWWPLNPEPANMPGLALATLIIGFAMVSPVTLPAGALGGWLLYWLGRSRREREQVT